MSGNIIRSAIHEWYTDPVITSLDSIATPIEFVQFPTVTVCNDKGNEVHDNWAFIESLLNFLHFNCEDPNGQVQLGEYCNGTDLLRQDFRYLFESIVDINKAWLFQTDNFNTLLNLFENDTEIRKNKDKGGSKLLKRAIDVISSGEMSMEELMNMPLENFNKYFLYQQVKCSIIFLRIFIKFVFTIMHHFRGLKSYSMAKDLRAILYLTLVIVLIWSNV